MTGRGRRQVRKGGEWEGRNERGGDERGGRGMREEGVEMKGEGGRNKTG